MHVLGGAPCTTSLHLGISHDPESGSYLSKFVSSNRVLAVYAKGTHHIGNSAQVRAVCRSIQQLGLCLAHCFNETWGALRIQVVQSKELLLA